MHSGTPSPEPPSQLVAECIASGRLCELCGARSHGVVLRATTYGPACLNLCPRCRTVPEPLQTRTAIAALDHRSHITRARDRGEIP